MAKKEYEKVAGGQYGVYREKPKKSGWGGVIGFIVVMLIIGAILS